MSQTAMLAAGGLACGMLAGASAQFGRLCTFAAIEDAWMARDFRRARAWLAAFIIALGVTQALVFAGLLNPLSFPYGGTLLPVGGTVIGGTLFGIGMALVGTCAFGLLVRGGAGDLRAVVNVTIVGITAFAATGGVLSDVRLMLSETLVADLRGLGGGRLLDVSRSIGGEIAAFCSVLAVLILSACILFAGSGLLRKPRLYAAAVGLGLAVAMGWVVTGVLADPFEVLRVESLSFVAPVGRLLLVLMGQSITGAAFAIGTVVGVVFGSAAVAAYRNELRWEAFDDPREMRRHLLGSMLMGFGGVLAQGCTVGQGLSAASVLAFSAPLALLGMVIGARIGLGWLLNGAPFLFRRAPTLRWRGMADPAE